MPYLPHKRHHQINEPFVLGLLFHLYRKIAPPNRLFKDVFKTLGQESCNKDRKICSNTKPAYIHPTKQLAYKQRYANDHRIDNNGNKYQRVFRLKLGFNGRSFQPSPPKRRSKTIHKMGEEIKINAPSDSKLEG